LVGAGYNVQLCHVEKETSWDELDEHGFVQLRNAAGKVLVRRGGFQHNRKLKDGGSWDPAAIKDLCNVVKKSADLSAAA